MARIINHEACNQVIGEGQTEYQPLPVINMGNEEGQCLSFWKLDDEELNILNQSKTIAIEQLTFQNKFQPQNLLVWPDELFDISEEPKDGRFKIDAFYYDREDNPVTSTEAKTESELFLAVQGFLKSNCSEIKIKNNQN